MLHYCKSDTSTQLLLLSSWVLEVCDKLDGSTTQSTYKIDGNLRVCIAILFHVAVHILPLSISDRPEEIRIQYYFVPIPHNLRTKYPSKGHSGMSANSLPSLNAYATYPLLLLFTSVQAIMRELSISTLPPEKEGHKMKLMHSAIATHLTNTRNLIKSEASQPQLLFTYLFTSQL
jgi:hypothetical protein